MSEEKQKRLKLLIYWCFGTVMIVFAAITAYPYALAGGSGLTIWQAVKAGFPIWGITILAAIVICTGYYFLYSRRED